ncbi:M20/M25/M40 family metallo-hydrolase [Cellulophaga sp. HaHaR_3_176]|uniref:M20/M25/M40 family metallo-hydrolase n=1 Tax=Cellulophaga sp. HaHaR_3_176 TaxID=1942464 RepID=UPI001C1F33BC|nr:M20/M25/M40 family metallo-hydrolase [Cellulophaga sp. HaHaR_3_176]QWX83025.1 M20/M25/M40 family metallo-hydrolase [Cellulophaga sp. HaHaR_3_176]
MKLKNSIALLLLIGLSSSGFTQIANEKNMLSAISDEGFNNSEAMTRLSQLTDVYGQRLTGSRSYLKAANWVSDEMKKIDLQNVHFENYCADCRGWDIKSFNVEMVAPNYMNISAYPLAMSKSSKGTVSGSVISIESFSDMNDVRKQFKGKLNGKIVLLGKEPKKKSLTDTIEFRFTESELKKMEQKKTAEIKTTPLPELFEGWKTEDRTDQDFLEFIEAEGALAVLTTKSMYLGVLHPSGTYYYKNGDLKPLPYFAIMPEHFSRLYRMIQLKTTPTIRLNLETEFYSEPENNVNIIGEITGNDPKLKSESILLGAHFDSWHSGTGATDNGANAIVLIEALRILKKLKYQPKRTLKIGLWGGEEQAFLGSAAYAEKHFGVLDKKPNKASKKISAYLNLDNGAGLIRGIYLQNNELARPVFKKIFDPIATITNNAITIENNLSTDHETFDYYNIPAFQFIQDNLAYQSVTHHTNLDFLEYVHEDDLMKNAVILAFTIYSLDNMQNQVPRKL